MDQAAIPLASNYYMQVRLRVHRPTITNRDAEAETFVNNALADASLVVVSKLFREKDNPINTLIAAIGQVYSTFRKLTHPHIDMGPRLLKNELYDEYRVAMRNAFDTVDTLKKMHMPKYDEYVQRDIAYRNRAATLKGEKGRATVADYPKAEEFEARIRFDHWIEPLPSNFMFDVDPEEVQKFYDAQKELMRNATNDAVGRMLKPLQHLASKLAVPIGEQGAIFRDSAVENLVEGLDTAKKMLVNPAPELQAVTDQLANVLAEYSDKVHWLRESPINREAAAAKLKAIEEQMSAWMGA